MSLTIGPYQTENGLVVKNGDPQHDQYVGMVVGECVKSSVPAPYPMQTLLNAQLTRTDIEILASISTYPPETFRLAPDVYDGNEKKRAMGYICWPYTNRIANTLVMGADCKTLFPNDEDEDKCEKLKLGVRMLADQPEPKSKWMFLKERYEGSWSGADFGVGLGVVGLAALGLKSGLKLLWKYINSRGGTPPTNPVGGGEPSSGPAPEGKSSGVRFQALPKKSIYKPFVPPKTEGLRQPLWMELEVIGIFTLAALSFTLAPRIAGIEFSTGAGGATATAAESLGYNLATRAVGVGGGFVFSGDILGY